jgi:hypothetical protein
MAQFDQRAVRLPCKVLNVNGDSAMVETSDGGQVTVTNIRVSYAYATKICILLIRTLD